MPDWFLYYSGNINWCIHILPADIVATMKLQAKLVLSSQFWVLGSQCWDTQNKKRRECYFSKGV